MGEYVRHQIDYFNWLHDLKSYLSQRLDCKWSAPCTKWGLIYEYVLISLSSWGGGSIENWWSGWWVSLLLTI